MAGPVIVRVGSTKVYVFGGARTERLRAVGGASMRLRRLELEKMCLS